MSKKKPAPSREPGLLREAVEECLRVTDLHNSPEWTVNYIERRLRVALDRATPPAPSREPGLREAATRTLDWLRNHDSIETMATIEAALDAALAAPSDEPGLLREAAIAYVKALDRVNDPEDTDNTVIAYEAAHDRLVEVARAALGRADEGAEGLDVEVLATLLDAHWLDRTDDGVGCSCGDWFFALSDDHPPVEVGDHFPPFSKHVAEALASRLTLQAGTSEDAPDG